MGTWPGDETRDQGRPVWPGDEGRHRVRPAPPQEQQQGDPAQARAQYNAQTLPQPYMPPPGYGQPVMYHPQVQPHSAGLAVLASFFIPGLGSMLNDKVGKGVGILLCSIISAILCLVVIGFVLSPAVWIWGMVAGNNDANKWNRAHGIIS